MLKEATFDVEIDLALVGNGTRCEEIWLRAGMLDKILGHGFRIGGATELLLMGTPPDVVATQYSRPMEVACLFGLLA